MQTGECLYGRILHEADNKVGHELLWDGYEAACLGKVNPLINEDVLMGSLHIKFIKNNHTKMELLYFDLYLAGNIEHIGRTRQNSRDNPEIEWPPVLTINLIIAINIKRSQEQQDFKVSIRHNKSIIRIPISSGLTGIVDDICIIL